MIAELFETRLARLMDGLRDIAPCTGSAAPVDAATGSVSLRLERRLVADRISGCEVAVVWALLALTSASIWLLPILLR